MTKKDTHKKAVLEALEQSLGVVTTACKMAGISRNAFYEWCKEDTEFKSAVDDMGEVAIDFAESSLFKQIKEGVPSSTIFFLKTRGKHRGYIEEKHVKGSFTYEDRATLSQADPKLLDALIASMEDETND